MSDVESYVGKLVPIDLDEKDLDEWIMETLGTKELKGYYENWLEALDDERWKEFHFDKDTQTLYKIDKEEFDPEEIFKVNDNKDGTYDFMVSFYNGGISFNEVLQQGIDKSKK